MGLKLGRPMVSLLLLALGLAGCGGTTTKTVTAPPPLKTSPACTVAPGHGSMGASQRCGPGLKLLPPLRAGNGQPGIDLSNNDPSFGSWSTIRHHAAFAYFKVSEGTGFIDGTAARMAREARAAGLYVGGYDFLHVCESNPVSEATVFVRAARAAHLLNGAGVLPPVGDFESGSRRGCSPGAWLAAWSDVVRRAVSRDSVYSDPGFYIPSVGCFHRADFGWVADLGGFQVLCGLPTIMHQFSFSYSDGVSRVDGDVFFGSHAQLAKLAGAAPKPTKVQLITRRRVLRRVLLRYGCDARRKHHQKLGPTCTRWFAEGARVNRELVKS